MSYTNGLIPDAALVTVAGGARLLSGPAAAWNSIVADVRREFGWTPRPTGSLDGFRPLSGNYYAQTETFLRRYEKRASGRGPYGDVRFWNGVRYVRVNGAAAAVPGTSNHGWGCAVDVSDLGGFTTVRYRQFASVAARYGWTNSEGRSIGEHWHWVDVGNAHLVKNGWTTAGVVPDAPTLNIPAPIEEDDMPYTPEEIEAICKKAALDAVVQFGRSEEFQLAKKTRDAERDAFHLSLRASMLEQANKAIAPALDLVRAVARKVGA